MLVISWWSIIGYDRRPFGAVIIVYLAVICGLIRTWRRLGSGCFWILGFDLQIRLCQYILKGLHRFVLCHCDAICIHRVADGLVQLTDNLRRYRIIAYPSIAWSDPCISENRLCFCLVRCGPEFECVNKLDCQVSLSYQRLGNGRVCLSICL